MIMLWLWPIQKFVVCIILPTYISNGSSGSILRRNFDLLDCTTPFEVTVITNAAADGIDGPANDANDVPSKGVCLDYVQIPCA